MKRIEFIAPVESMRGSFSPKQTLLYADNNNPAYEAPVGRNYARNYNPIFVGAKKASSGLKYFACKTKSATLISPASKLRMALLGAAGAIYAVITRNQESEDFAKLYAWYEAKLAQGVRGSLRKLATDHIMSEVNLHKQNIIFTTAGGPAVPFGLKNPWHDGTQTAGYAISSDVVVKFWKQLAANAITFTVDGAEGIAKTGMIFQTLIDETSYINVLGLTASDDHESLVQYKGQDVLNNGAEITTGEAVQALAYTTATE